MSKFHILVTDHLAEEGYEILKNDPDVSLDLKPGISNEDIKKILANYDAIITRSGTNVTADLLENTGKLKIIGRAGVGLDNVDIEAASKKGLIVMNAPTGNTIAAVELTMALILASARKVPAADQSVRAGEWNRKQFMGVQLQGKTLGIVGLGRIGSNVALRAQSFGMKIAVYDPYIKKEKADSIGATLYDSFEEVLKIADVLTFHTPLTEETKKMIRKETISLMKTGAILINCARGGIMDEESVCDAVSAGKLFAAATDVYEEEPPRKDSRLINTKNLFVTPHIGANTEDGQKSVAVIICEQVLNALHGRPYQYAVNTPFEREKLPNDMKLYFDISEKLGKMAAQLIDDRVEEIRIVMAGTRFQQNFGERTFDTPFNYQPFTTALAKGFLELFLQESVSYINAPYLAKDRGILITESRMPEYNKMNDHLVLTVKTNKEEVTFAATVFPDGKGRIVKIGKFNLDLITEGTYLYFKNIDTPGIVGKVGTLLGEHKINIANFELTRLEPKGTEAASFVSVDDEISQEVIEKLLTFEGILSAKVIKLS